ncbi:MAG TPA: cupin domain-containing protein [Rhodanobacteraceae bacterium]|nr:cupin domain-containing protein [Rhodanobacteraceae bacterium]
MDSTVGSNVESTIGPVGIDTAEHYRWGAVCDGWHLLKRDDFSVIRERVPPGAAETRHTHNHARQFFYVLDGAASIEVDGVCHALAAGQGLHVPPGAVHQFRNDSAADVHFLVVSVPKSHGDRENVDESGAEE